MGFNFRKSIRLAPGVRINLSKGGISVSGGTRGANVNLGRRGVKTTLSAPGTGFSWSKLFEFGK